MTDSLRTQIDSILAQCRAVIELGEKATAGPWHRGTNKGTAYEAHGEPAFPGVHDASGLPHGEDFVCQTLGNSDRCKASADFIAASRTLTPQLAAALIEAIEGLVEGATRGGFHENACSTNTLQRIASTFTQPSGGQQDDPGRERLKA